jgi:hypothetical protein
MTASMMDQRVRYIQRAAYWKTQGYEFDTKWMTASMMDQKVRDNQRAAHWKKEGYDFDVKWMTASMMDQKVRDIQRASYWKTQGYEFDSKFMTSSMMDRSVATQKPSADNAQVRTDAIVYGASKPISVPIYSGSPVVAENGDIRGADNDGDGTAEPVHVNGYFRKDGTYVRGHYRARPSRR